MQTLLYCASPASVRPMHSSSREGGRGSCPCNFLGNPKGANLTPPLGTELQVWMYPGPTAGAGLRAQGSPRKEKQLTAIPQGHSLQLQHNLGQLHCSPQREITTSDKPPSKMSACCSPAETSSPTFSSICSWKDWPKCKTNAIFQKP